MDTLILEQTLERAGFRLDVALRLPARGVTALMGASGSGKTTLWRCAAGLEPSARGHLASGERVWQAPGAAGLPPERRGIGLVFQQANLFGHLDVAGNLAFARKRAPRPVDPAALARDLGLEGLLRRRADTLSGGERQRAALARALASAPEWLLLDEPLAGLDEAARRDLLTVLDRTFRRLSIPVGYATHAVEEAAFLATHLVLLEAGRVRASGPLAELLADPDLPPAASPEALAVLDGTPGGYDEHDGLSRLDTPAGPFLVPGPPPDGPRRLLIRARDVSLTRERQAGTSILNIVPATVTALRPYGTAQVTVALRAGGAPLLARVTRRSAEGLGLAEGKTVHAQVKSVALAG
jgi:molybdate transport system ATP-binding protein